MIPPPATRRPPRRRRALLAALVLAGPLPGHQELPDGVIERIQWSEDVIGLLRRTTEALKRAVSDLELPGAAREHFTELVRVTDLAPAAPDPSPPRAAALASLVREREWSVTERETRVPRAELRLWQPLLEEMERFEAVGFAVVRGRFEGERGFRTDVKFSANARHRSGRRVHLSGHLDLHWTYGPKKTKKKSWRIDTWRTVDLHERSIAGPLFREVLDEAVPDPRTRWAARRSIQEERIVHFFLHPEEEKPRWFQAAAWDRHPGLAVVDVDGDGWDDLYSMDRWGPNQLLRNRGDGTFEDVAPRLGLDLEDHSSCALFLDIDNDDDEDVLVGRTLVESAYLLNEGRRFSQRPDLVQGRLPKLVSSLAAADVDRDGLLDVYVSTYAAATLQEELDVATAAPVTEDVVQRASSVLEEFLEPDQAARLGALFADDANLIRNRPGPPNAFLRNTGRGQLVRVPDDHPLVVWRNTYQSTFFDYDVDGDPDLYVANDFSPNALLENDGRGGFRDVTASTGTADIGFGMGASAGDFDADGDLDLYVSNMFTKAGRRITAQAAGLDERFKLMTRGNSLFLNRGESGSQPVFERVSGLEPPALLVEAAGWSWGGQFLDFNNDGWLDVYAPSGYYSAPDQIAIPVDT